VTDRGEDVPARLDGLWHTVNLLEVLGVEPALGRGFGPDDGREGASDAVLVSHGYWVRSLGADRNALGREVVLNGVPRTVVGVLPEGFRFLAVPVEVFIPYAGDPSDGAPDQHSWQAVGRLADGATLESAGAAVREVSADLARRHPETHEGFTASVIGIRAELLGEVAGTAAVVLLGAVGFVLLMACVNVANLLLSRSRERQGEMAVRTALGATRRRLVRQLMAEALLLSVVGGVGGAVIAIWGHRAIVGGLPSATPPALTFDFDVRVLLFSAGVVIASALLFGLVPALRTVQPAGDLREAGRGGTARATGGTLVVVQTALAVVLLAGGVAMTRGVISLHGQERGWSAEGVLTARLSPRSADYPDAASVTDFHAAILAAVRAVPGVEGAGAASSIPLQGSNQVAAIDLASAVDGRSDLPVRVTRLVPGYLDALRIGVRAGRDVTASDRLDTEPVALVNQSFVQRYLGGGDALDATFTWGSAEGPVRIVGVVENHIERAIDRPLEPSLYVPMAQLPTWTRTLVVRTSADPAALVPALRAAVARVDPAVPLFDVQTMPERVSERMAGFDLLAKLMGAFAVVSLALGAVGIYGVTARAVARRTREIGLRLALGADPGAVRRRIVGQSLRRVTLGMVLGLLLAVPLVGALQGLVVGIDPRSPASFVPAVLVLLAVAALGAWLPARSASRIDPARALAAE
ncbi:MAG: ABC transporter permease, partial [Gemmatimonadetes bacterium]|nr:ABC transporter permease [Gemmatimonadota bacterium]